MSTADQRLAELKEAVRAEWGDSCDILVFEANEDGFPGGVIALTPVPFGEEPSMRFAGPDGTVYPCGGRWDSLEEAHRALVPTAENLVAGAEHRRRKNAELAELAGEEKQEVEDDEEKSEGSEPEPEAEGTTPGGEEGGEPDSGAGGSADAEPAAPDSTPVASDDGAAT